VALKAQIVDLRFDLYGSGPKYIAIGGQQSLWVTCPKTAEVVGLMRDESVHKYPVDGMPAQIALAGESIWYTMPRIDAVGRIDHEGQTHTYKLPHDSAPTGIATLGDATWVTLGGTAELARLDTDGKIDIVPPHIDYNNDQIDPADGQPEFIAFDRMGSAWITLGGLGAVARVPVGAAEIHSDAWIAADHISPRGIAVDNAAVWITDYGDGGIWRIDRSIDELDRVEAWPKGVPSLVASDLAGGIWFSEPDEDLVGHMDADGRLSEYDISEYGTRPRGVVVDRDGVAWVVLISGGVIGVVG
jgi:virginiamycin B lyase